MNNLVYNYDGINIINLNLINNINNNINNIDNINNINNINNQYEIYKEKDLIFNLSKKNIIYNSDGFIYNYYKE